MAVPYTFGTATAAIPLSQLDSNFATAVTIGNTAVQLGNTVTTLNNLTLANVTISSGNVTITNVAVTTANVSGTANVSSLVVLTNETVLGNTAVTGNVTASINVTGAKLIPTGTSVTGNGLYLPAANALGLSTNGTNAVYIDASQNVGIGTASPSAKLTVTDSAHSCQIFIGYTDNNNYYQSSGAQIWSTYNGSSEYMRINSSGNLLVGVTSANANGGVLQLKSGITFPATQVSATDVNTLDDYEEGSWSPAITSSIGTITTVSAGGQYRKIGSLVVAQFQYAITNNGTGSGSIVINGLPFAGTVNTSAGTIREIAVVGFTGSSYLSGSTSMILVQYNNLYPGGTNYNVLGTVSYQSTS